MNWLLLSLRTTSYGRPEALELLEAQPSARVMQFNQTYVPEEASVQVNEPTEQRYYSEVLLQNCSTFPLFPATCETLLKGESVEMQFNQTCVPEEASVQVNKPMDHIHYSQVLQQNCSAIPDFPSALETLLQRESAVKFQEETGQTMSNLHSIGHRSTRISLTTRRERNRERERKRQTRLKGAFNVLRSVIPDYFSGREPGDRLSRIQTLRLAKKYIARLQELLETC